MEKIYPKKYGSYLINGIGSNILQFFQLLHFHGLTVDLRDHFSLSTYIAASIVTFMQRSTHFDSIQKSITYAYYISRYFSAFVKPNYSMCISQVFLLRQLWIVNYYVKKFVK